MAIVVAAGHRAADSQAKEPTATHAAAPSPNSAPVKSPEAGSCSLSSLLHPKSDPCSLAALGASIWDAAKLGASSDVTNLKQAAAEVRGGNIAPLLEGAVVLGMVGLTGRPQAVSPLVSREQAAMRHLSVAGRAIERLGEIGKIDAPKLEAMRGLLGRIVNRDSVPQSMRDSAALGNELESLAPRVQGPIRAAIDFLKEGGLRGLTSDERRMASSAGRVSSLRAPLPSKGVRIPEAPNLDRLDKTLDVLASGAKAAVYHLTGK